MMQPPGVSISRPRAFGVRLEVSPRGDHREWSSVLVGRTPRPCGSRRGRNLVTRADGVPARLPAEPRLSYWALACWLHTGRDTARVAAMFGLPAPRVGAMAATWHWRQRAATASFSAGGGRGNLPEKTNSLPTPSGAAGLSSDDEPAPPAMSTSDSSGHVSNRQLPVENSVWLSVWWPLAWIADLCHRAPATRAGYTSDLAAYMEWLDAEGMDLPAAGRGELARYRDALASGAAMPSGRPASAATMTRRFAAIRHAYDWLAQAGMIGYSPARSLPLPRVHPAARVVRQPWVDAEMREVVARRVDALHEQGYVSARDRALFLVLAYTAPRVGELVALRVRDLSLDGRLQWVGKGQSPRSVVLRGEPFAAVDEYLRQRRAEAPSWKLSGRAPLFATRSGRAVTARQVRKIVWRLCAAAGREYRSPHAWRHGLITALRDLGLSRDEVQAYVGHARAESTAVYEHASPHRGDAGMRLAEWERVAG